jgi:two-component system LytT family response regulator
MKHYSALILDDEVENIALLELYLSKYCKQIQHIHTSTKIEEALEIFVNHQPDILFLDIDLGNNSNSFDLIEKYNLGSSQIIFITSHEHYALKAINANNVAAYLLKPLQIDDLLKAVEKAIMNLNHNDVKRENETQNANFIAISSLDRIDIILTKDIMYCSADGKYTHFYTKNNKKHTSSRNLGDYQELLNAHYFFRIHSKHIVNINFVSVVNKADGYYCELANGETLPIAKRRKEDFNRFLKLRL